jgi:hypothetical protein
MTITENPATRSPRNRRRKERKDAERPVKKSTGHCPRAEKEHDEEVARRVLRGSSAEQHGPWQHAGEESHAGAEQVLRGDRPCVDKAHQEAVSGGRANGQEGRKWKNPQQREAEGDHDKAGGEGQSGPEPPEERGQRCSVKQGRGKGAQKTIGDDPSRMKGHMVKNTRAPQTKRRSTGGIQVEGISKDQRAAHAEAMETAGKADKEGHEKVEHIRT